MSYPDGGVPSQRAASWIEQPASKRGAARMPSWLVALAVGILLLGVGAGVLAALFMPYGHGARAEILYSINNSDQGGDPLKQDRQLSTQVVLLKSPAVLGPVAKKQGRQFESLSKEIDAGILSNSNVIEVKARGATDQAALQTLQAVVANYVTLTTQPSGLTRNLQAQLVTARQNTTALQARVLQLTPAVLAGTATQASLNDVRAQLTAALDWEKAIQARIDEVAVSGQAGSAAQVLTPPYVLPPGFVTTPRVIAISIGALGGLIVAGLVLASRAPRATPVGERPVQPRRPGYVRAKQE